MQLPSVLRRQEDTIPTETGSTVEGNIREATTVRQRATAWTLRPKTAEYNIMASASAASLNDPYSYSFNESTKQMTTKSAKGAIP